MNERRATPIRKFYTSTPILVDGTWYNVDGTVEQAKKHAFAHFMPSDYAKAVTLNNKIMAAIVCATAFFTVIYKVL